MITFLGKNFVILKLLVLISIISFVSCSPKSTSTSTPLPITVTLTPTIHLLSPTQTPQNLSEITDLTSLFSGPGNLEFEEILKLESGTKIIALGKFGDFIKIRLAESNIEGFVFGRHLNLSNLNIPDLLIDEVPWVEEKFADNCSGPYSEITEDNLRIINDTSEWTGAQSKTFNLSQSAKIKMQLHTNNGSNGVVYFIVPNTFTALSKPGFPKYFAVIVNSDGYSFQVFDGVTQNPIRSFYLNYKDKKLITITISDELGKEIVISDENEQIIELFNFEKLNNSSLKNGIFLDKKFAIICEVDPLSTFYIDDGIIELSPSGKYQEKPDELPNMRSFAEKHDVSIGSPVDVSLFGNKKYSDLIYSTFDTIVLPHFSYQNFWVGPGEYNHKDLETMINFLYNNGFEMRALHLVYGSYDTIPNWLKEGNYTREEYIDFLRRFVTDNMTFYKGKINEWSLANEAVNHYGNYGYDFWADKIGWEYIDLVFKWAREADPNAILILNADNNECPRDEGTQINVDRMFEIVKNMKANGTPIDGVGMQMHILLPWNSPIIPEKSCVVETMNKFANLGVDVYITEFDVNTVALNGDREERLQQEAEIYGEMMGACLESLSCKSFSTFGIDDPRSWLNDVPEINTVITKENLLMPLMFDNNLNPKPAYFSVLNSLQTNQ